MQPVVVGRCLVFLAFASVHHFVESATGQVIFVPGFDL
jgi:hypothetical protein